jgi:hypothetical protein
MKITINLVVLLPEIAVAVAAKEDLHKGNSSEDLETKIMMMKMNMTKKMKIHTVNKMMRNTTMKKLHHLDVLVADGIALLIEIQLTFHLIMESNKEENKAQEQEMDKGKSLERKLERGRSYLKDKEEGKKIVILLSNQKETIKTHTFQMMTSSTLLLETQNETTPSGNRQNTFLLKLWG